MKMTKMTNWVYDLSFWGGHENNKNDKSGCFLSFSFDLLQRSRRNKI